MNTQKVKHFEEELVKAVVENIVGYAKHISRMIKMHGSVINKVIHRGYTEACIYRIPGYTSAEKLRMAKKLQKEGLIELWQNYKRDVWRFTLADIELRQKMFEKAIVLYSSAENIDKSQVINQILDWHKSLQRSQHPCSGKCPRYNEEACGTCLVGEGG